MAVANDVAISVPFATTLLAHQPKGPLTRSLRLPRQSALPQMRFPRPGSAQTDDIYLLFILALFVSRLAKLSPANGLKTDWESLRPRKRLPRLSQTFVL